MPENKNVTLREVATKAGVSIATVSRILNNSAKVNADIEKNVRKVIQELGYYQNSIARSLKTNSTYTIAFVTANISNPYIITVAKAIEDLIRVKGYNLLVCSTAGEPDRELEYLQLQMGRSIDGLVLNGTGYNQEYVANISKRIPVVLVHRRYDEADFVGDFVDSDNDEGTYGLTKHLLSFGHRKIFVMKGEKHTSSNQDRMNGFCRAMKEAGIIVDDNYPFQFDGDFSERSGFDAVKYMCTLNERPTALLGFNNTITLGALRGLKSVNISVPESISIASYNNIDNKDLMQTRPTVHDVDPRHIGLAVGKLLLERLKNRDLENRKIVVRGHMVSGNAVSVPTNETNSEKNLWL